MKQRLEKSSSSTKTRQDTPATVHVKSYGLIPEIYFGPVPRYLQPYSAVLHL